MENQTLIGTPSTTSSGLMGPQRTFTEKVIHSMTNDPQWIIAEILLVLYLLKKK